MSFANRRSSEESALIDKIFSELSQECRCPICLDFLKEPRNAPCQHNFCQECIFEHIKDNHSECPTCRCPGVNKRSLAKNNALANITVLVQKLASALGIPSVLRRNDTPKPLNPHNNRDSSTKRKATPPSRKKRKVEKAEKVSETAIGEKNPQDVEHIEDIAERNDGESPCSNANSIISPHIDIDTIQQSTNSAAIPDKHEESLFLLDFGKSLQIPSFPSDSQSENGKENDIQSTPCKRKLNVDQPSTAKSPIEDPPQPVTALTITPAIVRTSVQASASSSLLLSPPLIQQGTQRRYPRSPPRDFESSANMLLSKPNPAEPPNSDAGQQPPASPSPDQIAAFACQRPSPRALDHSFQLVDDLRTHASNGSPAAAAFRPPVGRAASRECVVSSRSPNCPPIRPTRSQHPAPVLLLTGFSEREQQEASAVIQRAGGRCHRDFDEHVTHVLCKADEEGFAIRSKLRPDKSYNPSYHQLAHAVASVEPWEPKLLDVLRCAGSPDHGAVSVGGSAVASLLQDPALRGCGVLGCKVGTRRDRGPERRQREGLRTGAAPLLSPDATKGRCFLLCGPFSSPLPKAQDLLQLLHLAGARVLERPPSSARELPEGLLVLCDPSKVDTAGPVASLRRIGAQLVCPLYVLDSISCYEVLDPEPYLLGV